MTKKTITNENKHRINHKEKHGLLCRNFSFQRPPLYYFIFTISFSLFTFSLTLAAAPDSLQTTALSSEKIVQLKSIWELSENAASLQFFDIQHKIGSACLHFNNEKGDYHLFQQEQQKNEIGFCTKGYVKLDKWKFYGDFNYFNENDEGIKYVDVLEPYNDNPYTLGDIVGGKYYKEFFKMRGKAAWQANDLLSLGCDFQYKTGVGARRKDPRPENEITCFDIIPGIVLNFENIKIGVNLKYKTGKEDIELVTVTDSIYDFYHFKALGAFTSTTEIDDRSHETELLGGGFQFNWNGEKISNLTELNFYREETDIKRGKTFPLQVVLLEKFNTALSSVFMFSSSKKRIKKLTFRFNDKRIFGHEPVVEPKLEQVSYQWNTLAKYTVYWFNSQEFGVDYSWYKLINTDHFNWGGKISAKMLANESSYYFVPEFNRQKLNYFNLNALLEKEVQAKKTNFVFSIEGGYQKGFNSSLKIVTDEILLEGVNVDFVNHDYNYFNEPVFNLGGAAQLGKRLDLYKSPVQLILSAEYKRLFSGMNEKPNREIFSLKLGVNF